MAAGDSVQAFYAAREFLVAHREDYDTAYRDFRWPEIDEFNWALDHFDAVAADPRARRRSGRCGSSSSDGSRRALDLRRAGRRGRTGWPTGCASAGVAARRPDHPDARQPGRAVGDAAGRDEARRRGHPGDHAAARPPTCATGWTAAAPGTSSSAAADTGKFDDVEGDYTRIAVRGRPRGLARLRRRRDAASDAFTPDGVTRGSDTLLLYFTSGTTAKPEARRAHPRLLPGRAPVDDVLDRAASPATCTSTSPRRAGPSTPGATSSPRGSPSPACW